MSAYVVDDVTINRILSYALEPGPAERAGLHRWLGARLAPLGLALVNTADAAHLGTLLRALNVEAVTQRYGEDLDGMIPERPFAFEMVPVSAVQAYKSLCCWLYQCAEGNVPAGGLYAVLEGLGGVVAESIVKSLDAWDAAEWG